MSERKLAHIERIISIEPHPNADTLELVTVLGWKVICKKGEYKPGDLVCYIECDSIVPQIPYFEFMAQRKYRVRAIKLRGIISQGLIVPLSIINKENSYKEGQDVTKDIGIIKWLSPSEREEIYNITISNKKKHNFFIKFMTRFSWFRKLFKKKSKSFPEWISKTDEERIQNIPWILKDKRDMIITEKLDGQSATYWIKKRLFGFEFGICSRSVRKFEYDKSNWSEVARKYDIKNKLKPFKNLAIQGEIIGPRIQGNPYNVKELYFFVFNVYDIQHKKFYNYNDAQTIVHFLNLTFVPYIDTIKLPDTVDELLKYSTGESLISKVPREGIVIRTPDKSISFKCVSPEYLLKCKYNNETFDERNNYVA